MEQGAGGKDGEFLSQGEKSAREKMAEGRLKGRNVNQVQRSVCTKLRWGGRESLRGANIGEKRVKGEGECSARDGWAASFVQIRAPGPCRAAGLHRAQPQHRLSQAPG